MDHGVDDVELREVAEEHLTYEMIMLVRSAWLLKTLGRGGPPERGTVERLVYTITLESFLLHSRVLDEFLSKPPFKQDVRASHFFDEPLVLGRSDISERIDEISQRLVHLSSLRVGEVGWSTLQEMGDSVATRLGSFLEQLQDRQPDRAAWFEDVARWVERWWAIPKGTVPFEGDISTSVSLAGSVIGMGPLDGTTN